MQSHIFVNLPNTVSLQLKRSEYLRKGITKWQSLYMSNSAVVGMTYIDIHVDYCTLDDIMVKKMK